MGNSNICGGINRTSSVAWYIIVWAFCDERSRVWIRSIPQPSLWTLKEALVRITSGLPNVLLAVGIFTAQKLIIIIFKFSLKFSYPNWMIKIWYSFHSRTILIMRWNRDIPKEYFFTFASFQPDCGLSDNFLWTSRSCASLIWEKALRVPEGYLL